MTNDNIVEPIQNQENPLEDVQVWSQRLIGKTIVFDNVAITEEVNKIMKNTFQTLVKNIILYLSNPCFYIDFS